MLKLRKRYVIDLFVGIEVLINFCPQYKGLRGVCSEFEEEAGQDSGRGIAGTRSVHCRVTIENGYSPSCYHDQVCVTLEVELGLFRLFNPLVVLQDPREDVRTTRFHLVRLFVSMHVERESSDPLVSSLRLALHTMPRTFCVQRSELASS